MNDDFADFNSGLTSPAAAADPIAPSDTTVLPTATRAIYVGQGGDLTVEFISGDTVTLYNVQPGAVYALRVRHVLATGTTATGLVGLR
jgi:hypothetical protein